MSPSLFEVTGLGPRQGPMSIEDIISEAENMLGGYNPNIPLRFYLRSADAINKQVGILFLDNRTMIITVSRLKRMNAMAMKRKPSNSTIGTLF